MKDDYIRGITDALAEGAMELSLQDYIEALEDVKDDIDSRIAAAREDLKRQDEEVTS